MSHAVDVVKSLVPGALKDYVKDTMRKRLFSQSLVKFRSLASDQLPSRPLLDDLIHGWGNEGYSAMHEYLRELVRTARQVDGPILECGSGLSTILVGIEAQKRGLMHYALEHNPDWASRVRHELDAAGVRSVVVCDTPLRSYGEYAWYDVSRADLPARLAMVICDGPPGDTPGGRYGLVPVLRDRLAPGCLVMLDDAGREEEHSVLERWARETGGSITELGTDKAFAVLRLT